MIKFADRVKEIASVSGGGAYNFSEAVPGHQGFVDSIGDGSKCAYCAEGGSSWEVGEGTVDAGIGTLSRDKILSSSNGGALVNWPNGSVYLYCVAPASVIQRVANSGISISIPGTLQVQAGTARWYPPGNVSFSQLEAWLGVHNVGADLKFSLLRNGSLFRAGTILPSIGVTSVVCAVAYDLIAGVIGDMNADNLFDGVPLSSGARVLLVDWTGVNYPSDIYVVGGVPGNWTVTRIDPISVPGAMVFSSGGAANTNTYFTYNGTTWILTAFEENPSKITTLLNPILNLSPADWLSLNITQVGSITPGSDFHLRLT